MPRQRTSWDVSKGSSGHPWTPSGSVETLHGNRNIENDCIQTGLQGAINFWLAEAGKLEPERRALFLRVSNAISYEGYVTDLAKAIKDTANVSKLSRFSRKMKPIYQLSNSIAPIVTSASQFTPMPASLVLGGITCILSLSTRVDDFQSKLLETLEWMADEVDLINDYRHESIFDGDVAIEACEINLAADILKFCIEVTNLFYDDHGRQKSSLVFALKGLCKDFDVRFGDIKTEFKSHLTSLEKRRNLVNARKLRSVHVGLHDISKMLKREHEDEDGVDRAEPRMGWHQEERRRRFLNWLPSLDFGNIQENNFERRVPGSGDWLMDHEDFQTWRRSAVSSLLWIHGKPGSGKSHLAARVIHDLRTSPSGVNRIAVAFAYCTTTETKTRMTLNNVLGSILGQLYKQLPITEDIETFLSRSDASSKEEPQRSEMKEGIRMVISRLHSSCIVIDGLDECSHFPDRQFEDLCNFLASLAETKDAGVSTHILVLSRPEYKAIESAFSEYSQIQIGNGANDGDIKAYISQKVDDINTSPSSEERVEFEEIKALMFNNAGGLFLWVHFKAKHFKEIGSVEDIKDALHDIGEGLDDLYGEEIGKILSHPSRFVRDRALRALLWVTNSFRSLSKAELLEALSMKPGRMGINQSQRLPQEISISTECADLISEINGVFQLRHASLKDFLSSKLPTLLSYRALQQQAHMIMAETCLTYISFEDFNVVRIHSPQELSDLEARYPLLDYAISFWGHHFSEREQAKAEYLDALLSRFLVKEAAIRLSIQVQEFRGSQNAFWNTRVGKPTALHILAIFNLAEVAAKVSAFKSHLTDQDDFNRIPIEYSVLYRHRKMSRWLLNEHLREYRNGQSLSSPILESCKDWLLHNVAEENWDDMVENLVAMGLDANAHDFLGESPLHAAMRTSANCALNCLLKLGGLPNAESDDGQTPLTLAAFHLNSEGVDILLKAGADARQPGKNGMTPLHIAAGLGLIDIALNLLEHGASVDAACSCTSQYFGQTPLHYAVRANMADMVHLLINHGACVESKTSFGDTAMLIACHMGHLNVLNDLIQHGADVSVSNPNDRSTGLHVAAKRGHHSLVKRLLVVHKGLLNAVDKRGNTPLLVALYKGHSKAAKVLIEAGARSDMANVSNSTPLQVAVDRECLEIAKLLLKNPQTVPDRPGHRRKTALHHAAERGLDALLHFFPNHMISTETKDKRGFTPVHYAAANNHHRFISLLMNLAPETNINSANIDGWTPVHSAARNGAVDTVKLLLASDPYSCGTKDIRCRLPIHMAALSGYAPCVAELYTSETIDCQDEDGATPLWLACRDGHYEVAKYLVEQGANVGLRDVRGMSPIFVCLRQKYFHIAALLTGSDCKQADEDMMLVDDIPLFSLATRSGDEGLLNYFSQFATGKLQTTDDIKINWLALDERGWDAMSYAANSGHANVIDILLRLGIPIDGLGRSMISPLATAAQSGFTEFVSKAVSQGARIRNMDYHWDRKLGRDALIHATLYRRKQTAATLLAQGADPTIRDVFGHCATDYAARHPNLWEIFSSWTDHYSPSISRLQAQAKKAVILRVAKSLVHAEHKQDGDWKERHQALVELSTALLLLNTGNGIEQARLCKIEIVERHLRARRECDVCLEYVSTPSYHCSVCEDLDLCRTCYEDYCCSTPPRTIPEQMKGLWELENEIYPVLRVAEIFRTYGAETLPSSFRLLGRFVEDWIDAKVKGYSRWAKHCKLRTKWETMKLPGRRFVELLDGVRMFKWLDPQDENQQGSSRAQHLNDIRTELSIIYDKFDPRSEPNRPTCDGHHFFEILAYKDLSSQDQHHFNSDGRLTDAFFEGIAHQYSDFEAYCIEDININTDDVATHVLDASDSVSKNEEDHSNCPSGSDVRAKENLRAIRGSLMKNAAMSSGGAPGEVTHRLDVCEVAWKLAHAMLQIPYEESLASISSSKNFG